MTRRVTFLRCGIIAANGCGETISPASFRVASGPTDFRDRGRCTPREDLLLFHFFCICLKNEMVEWFLPLAKGTGGIRFREETAYLFLDGRNGEESSLCAR